MKLKLTEINSPKLTPVIKCFICWILFIVSLFVTGTLVTPLFPPGWERFIYGIFGTVAAFMVIWIILRVEHKTFFDYGLTWERLTIARFATGLFCGTAIFTFIILAMLIFTDLSMERSRFEWHPQSSFWYLSIIPLALMEEVAFRSYSLIKLDKAFGLRIALPVSAIAFAIYHIITGWNVQMAFLGPGIWAFVFGLSAIWSKGIALPTGLHVALNLGQQLVGMKAGTGEPVWVLKSGEHASSASISQADFVGLLIQVFILAATLVLTEVYLRKTKKTLID
ncbi:MAG: CPBP family intramembrane glutamic endopeptidase [Bacteroidales bacterium]